MGSEALEGGLIGQVFFFKDESHKVISGADFLPALLPFGYSGKAKKEIRGRCGYHEIYLTNNGGSWY
jgi:hypothetical protein